ncbi:MAG: efflux transporter periplasmic adaptor subunit [Moraxellaceae bacterium]|nr:MAG: efflux transporter periplasmic adaptor subunit [Moraxellaceae bacterium]
MSNLNSSKASLSGSSLVGVFIGVAVGVFLGFAIVVIASRYGSDDAESSFIQLILGDDIGDREGGRGNKKSAASQAKPIYWVAPMDSNFRRDKPGLSPMGMDLIAVYGSDSSGNDDGPGTVKISSAVINNLGVRTAVVERRQLESSIRTVGYVRYDEDNLIHIHPRVEGWIDTLYVQAAGDPVKKGQPLYALYSPTLVNAQEELLLALERKNKRLIEAAEQRLRALQIPAATISALKKNRKVKQSVIFFSPLDGVVDHLQVRKGFFVQPGTTMMAIGSVEQVWVEAEIFERQASLVYQGASVTMTLNYLPGGVWRGVVDYVYPVIDAKTRTMKVRMRFSNEAGELKPNMFAQVVIETASEADTLLVPKEALIRTGRMNRLVMALGEGRFKTVEVGVGRFGTDFVEILSGVAEGERVVTSAQFLIDSESSKTSDFKRLDSSAVAADIEFNGQAQSRIQPQAVR